VKIAVEVLLMLHLVSAFPIIVNPNNQFFEELLGFPKGKPHFNGQKNKISTGLKEPSGKIRLESGTTWIGL
jgi:hypothetical protein